MSRVNNVRNLRVYSERNKAMRIGRSHSISHIALKALLVASLTMAIVSRAAYSQLNAVPSNGKGQSMVTHTPVSDVRAVSTSETVTPVSKDDATDAGEPVTYPAGGSPEVTSAILMVPPGGKTEWMTHPVPGYVYVLEGTLTVEFEDGHHLTFHAGQGFLQARTRWHRGINQGSEPLRFLAVFFGVKGVPIILHPPKPAQGEMPR